jgi:pimeloyl-ACP methyl ester carboxylesterase
VLSGDASRSSDEAAPDGTLPVEGPDPIAASAIHCDRIAVTCQGRSLRTAQQRSQPFTEPLRQPFTNGLDPTAAGQRSDSAADHRGQEDRTPGVETTSVRGIRPLSITPEGDLAMTTDTQLITTDVPDTMTTHPVPRRRWRLRAGRGLVALLAMTLAAGGVQTALERRDARANPAPGELVTLSDGRQLHLQVAGEDNTGPTVVLMSGAGASVVGWGWVLPAVAEHRRVVAYDRAGIGWSDPADTPSELDTVIEDLRSALVVRDVPGPYLLVGHSLGAHHARAFAERYLDEVAGVVLVDPAHVEAAAVMGQDPASMRPFFTGMNWLARIGGLRVWQTMEADLHRLPQPQRDAAVAQFRSSRYWTAIGSEIADLDRVGRQLDDTPGSLGNLPLHVIIATAGATTSEQQRQLQQIAALREDIATLSQASAVTTLPEANHVTVITDRDHAGVVTDSILQLARR